MAETDSKKYERGTFVPSTDYNTAIGNVTSAKTDLDALGEAKWYYGTDSDGKPLVGDDVLKGYISGYENRDAFSYDFNTDALYQQYKNKYIQQGKMAMADTMGQAAAMTGGYGNSYAQTVGQQQYQASLDNLNDVIPELYQLAYDKYNQEGQDMLNMISLLRGERSNYYDRYNEDYARIYDDMTYWTDQANKLYERDYTKYSDDEDYKYQTHRDSITDGFTERELKMKEEAWNLEKSELQKVVDSTTYSGKGTHPTGGNYDNGGYSDAVVKQAQKFVGADADGKWGTNSTSAASAAGYGSLAEVVKAMGGLGIDLSQIPGINTNDASYFDSNGNFKKAEYTGKTSDGKATFTKDGKTETLEVGVNPYTKTKNPDVKNGTFSNGYQPNNVDGKKLSKSGIQDYMNGVLQNVWKTSDGKLWIWDGTQNEYLEYQE